jgi:hypothetical protein
MRTNLVAAVLLFLPATTHAKCLQNVDATVPSFSFRGGSRVDAALALGQQMNLCLGLRNLPRKAFLEPVLFDFREEKAFEIIQQMFRGLNVQVTRSAGGMINVVQHFEGKTLFDHVIPSFEVGRTTLQTLSMGIRIRLERELNPEIQGVAGSYPTGDQTDLVGPFHEHGRTVSQLLDTIVSHSKGASWVSLVADSGAVRSVPDNMWVVIQYNRPTADYKALLAAAGSKLPGPDESK